MELKHAINNKVIASATVLEHFTSHEEPCDTSGAALKEWSKKFINPMIFTQLEKTAICGTYIATQNLGAHTSIDFWHQAIQDDLNFANPRNFPSTLANALASQLAIHTKSKGPSLALLGGPEATSACMQHALTDLNNKCIDYALVVSVNSFFDQVACPKNQQVAAGWLLTKFTPTKESPTLKLIQCQSPPKQAFDKGNFESPWPGFSLILE